MTTSACSGQRTPSPRPSPLWGEGVRGDALAAALGLAVLGAAVFAAATARSAEMTVMIDNFTFNPPRLTVTAGTTVTWDNEDDIPHTVASSTRGLQIESARYERQVLVHVCHAGRLRVLLLAASPHDGHSRGGDHNREQCAAMMLARWREGREPLASLPRSRGRDRRGSEPMAGRASVDPDLARRFRDAAVPYLDEVYSLARYLLRNPADAEDAVQECYLRALRHFETFQGPAIKPWLMAILRNVCRAEYGRRKTASDGDAELADSAVPLWQEPQQSPEGEILRRKD